MLASPLMVKERFSSKTTWHKDAYLAVNVLGTKQLLCRDASPSLVVHRVLLMQTAIHALGHDPLSSEKIHGIPHLGCERTYVEA